MPRKPPEGSVGRGGSGSAQERGRPRGNDPDAEECPPLGGEGPRSGGQPAAGDARHRTGGASRPFACAPDEGTGRGRGPFPPRRRARRRASGDQVRAEVGSPAPRGALGGDSRARRAALERLNSEASFASLCGVSPIEASSGKVVRHRLNRGSNREANRALHMICVVRMGSERRTRSYVARRTAEGKSKREIMRCLKRYIAREVYRILLCSTTVEPSPSRSEREFVRADVA